MTAKANAATNQKWLEEKDKELDFVLWCKFNDLELNDESLQLFRNKAERAEQRRKMVKPFSKVDGFFVEWGSSSGSCSVFNRDKKLAEELFAILRSRVYAELFSWKDGVLERIA